MPVAFQDLMNMFLAQLSNWAQTEFEKRYVFGDGEDVAARNANLQRNIELEAAYKFKQFRHTLCDLALMFPGLYDYSATTRDIMNHPLVLNAFGRTEARE